MANGELWHGYPDSAAARAGLRIAELASAQEERFSKELVRRCDYAFTLQSRFRVAALETPKAIDRAKSDIRSDLGRFSTRLDEKISFGRNKRDDDSRIIFVPVIEGELDDHDPEMSLHVHGFLGNVGFFAHEPKRLKRLIRRLWEKTDSGTADVHIRKLFDPAGWGGPYMHKERLRGLNEKIEWQVVVCPNKISAEVSQRVERWPIGINAQ